MSRAERFLLLYNELDAFLRERTGLHDRWKGFGEVLREAAQRDAGVRRFEQRIRPFIELRNIIVHDSRFGPAPIAEPNARALAEFESCVRAIIKPPRAGDIGSEPRRVFRPDDPLAEALRHMRDGDFSQVIVKPDGGDIRLLTTEGVARWLENKIAEEIIEVTGVPIVAALDHEPAGLYRLIRRNATVHEVRDAFDALTGTGARLYAVIVTESGRPAEAPLRIITPWDLLATAEYATGDPVAAAIS